MRTIRPGARQRAGQRVFGAVQILTESLATSPRCGWCLLDLTRVKSGRACLPRQARQPRQPDRRAPIYQQSECDASLACRLAASSNRVGRSPTGGPLIRPSDPCRRVNAGKPFCVKPGNAPNTRCPARCRAPGRMVLICVIGSKARRISRARCPGTPGYIALPCSNLGKSPLRPAACRIKPRRTPGRAFTAPSPSTRPSRNTGLSFENSRFTVSIPKARRVASNRRQFW